MFKKFCFKNVRLFIFGFLLNNFAHAFADIYTLSPYQLSVFLERQRAPFLQKLGQENDNYSKSVNGFQTTFLSTKPSPCNKTPVGDASLPVFYYQIIQALSENKQALKIEYLYADCKQMPIMREIWTIGGHDLKTKTLLELSEVDGEPRLSLNLNANEQSKTYEFWNPNSAVIRIKTFQHQANFLKSIIELLDTQTFSALTEIRKEQKTNTVFTETFLMAPYELNFGLGSVYRQGNNIQIKATHQLADQQIKSSSYFDLLKSHPISKNGFQDLFNSSLAMTREFFRMEQVKLQAFPSTEIIGSASTMSKFEQDLDMIIQQLNSGNPVQMDFGLKLLKFSRELIRTGEIHILDKRPQ